MSGDVRINTPVKLSTPHYTYGSCIMIYDRRYRIASMSFRRVASFAPNESTLVLSCFIKVARGRYYNQSLFVERRSLIHNVLPADNSYRQVGVLISVVI